MLLLADVIFTCVDVEEEWLVEEEEERDGVCDGNEGTGFC